jgi:hypothetical protein
VNGFLRPVDSFDPQTGRLSTITLSEPILAYAATRLLCGEITHWNQTIPTVSHHLIHQGIVAPGPVGEIFARILFILARDWLNFNIESNPHFTVKDFLQSV